MTPKSEKNLRVIDSSLTEESKHRIHEIVVNGKIIPITFVYGKETILPFEQGMKFMKDGFKVEEVDGAELNLPVVPSDNVSAQLKEDECVARFSELTLSALLLRVAQKNGGEIYLNAGEGQRDNVIAFLSGKPPVGMTSASEEGDSKESEDEETIDPSAPVPTPNTPNIEDAKRIAALVEKFGATRWVEDENSVSGDFSFTKVKLFGGDAGDELIVQGMVKELEEFVISSVKAEVKEADSVSQDAGEGQGAAGVETIAAPGTESLQPVNETEVTDPANTEKAAE